MEIETRLIKLKIMFEALDIVRTKLSYEYMTIVSCERGCTPNIYYCIDDFGNGKWYNEDEIFIAKWNDKTQIY